MSARASLTTRQLLLVDAIAERVAELLHDEPWLARLVDAATVADALGVSRDCVYAHAEQLGGHRVGDGPRGRLRFDLDQARAAWTSCLASRRSQEAKPPARAGNSAPRRGRPTATKARLLPIKGSGRTTDDGAA